VLSPLAIYASVKSDEFPAIGAAPHYAAAPTWTASAKWAIRENPASGARGEGCIPDADRRDRSRQTPPEEQGVGQGDAVAAGRAPGGQGNIHQLAGCQRAYGKIQPLAFRHLVVGEIPGQQEGRDSPAAITHQLVVAGDTGQQQLGMRDNLTVAEDVFMG
jgi:hypothetical protein